MSCFTALDSQFVTFLSVPHEVLLLRHKVFREYAKIAVGPDFIHTLPSFLILTATLIFLWKNPPSFGWLLQTLGSTTLYRTLQVSATWIATNAILWTWLVLQRVLYCWIWTYWTYESEYREMTYQWWQRVWSSYYPPRLQPPIMSADFISWIISMLIALTVLGCSLSTTRVRDFIVESASRLQDTLVVAKCYAHRLSKRMPEVLTASSKNPPIDDSELSSVCDDCRSEVSSEINQPRRDVYPVSYGTNWVPKSSPGGYGKPQRNVSVKSLHTVAVVNDVQDPEKLSPRQLRNRRGCHTVIPSNSSDKSSEC